jgi:hypothetical protein
MNKTSCIVALFQDDKDNCQKPICDFRFSVNQSPSTIYALADGSILLYNIYFLVFNCKSGNRHVEGCKFCVLIVPCESSVSTENIYLPGRLTSCHNNTESKLYPVNLALFSVTKFSQ